MASTQKAKIPVGFVIAGKYRVTGELGRGGMASVYEAENVDIGKRVAIKVLAQELTSSTVVVERFLREARAVAAIRSPYICDVYDSGRLEDGRPFLVLELLEGESLYERMVRVGQIDLETTVIVMSQACRGLIRAHAVGIVHRDLKPENIFVTKDEEGNLLSKILDFGLAKFYQPVDEGTEQARLTREGAVFGTPAYMSPEQVRGQGAVDARADLWALGCITYECLTARTVWSTEQGVAMTFAQIAQNNLPDPLQFRPDLPVSFRTWFQRALHKDIAQRFQSPKEFADELLAAMDLSSPNSRASEASQDIFFLTRQASSAAIPPSPDSSPHTPKDAPKKEEPPAPPPPAPLETTNSAATKSAEPAPAPSSGGRGLLVVTLTALIAGGGYYAWRTTHPAVDPLAASASASADASASPSGSALPAATSSAVSLSHDSGLPFRPLISQAQELILKGDLEAARAKVKEAVDQGAHYVPQTFMQHLDAVKAGNKQEPLCALRGLGRPRTADILAESIKPTAASWPALGVGPSGTVVIWTETVDGKNQVYSVALDEALRARSEPHEVTPEGLNIQKPDLIAVGDRFLVTYWETAGPEAGVYGRFIDGEGRIASSPSLIAKVSGGASQPTATATKDGFLFSWVEPSDKNTEDFYARFFNANLQGQGEKARLTAFHPAPSGRTKVRFPLGAVDKDNLRLTFRLERDPERVVEHLSIPLGSIEKGETVKVDGLTSGSPDRFLGALEPVSPPKQRADLPSMACSSSECFVVWHEETKDGIYSAPIPLDSPKPLFKKEVVKNAGRHPAVASDASGAMQLFWYERGRLVTSKLDRDGIREASTIARMTTPDRPTSTPLAGRKPGEWFVTWNDFEGGHPEVFVARVECK